FDVPQSDTGRALRDLEVSYKPVDLRTPIDRVVRERRPTFVQGIQLKRGDGTPATFDLHVVPLIDEDGSVVGTTISLFDVSAQIQLRTDLVRMRQELQSNKEELETTNEELQSTVEELETTNEELQSTNDELVVVATTRKGRQIRCRVMAHTLGDGEQPSGVVLVMEELNLQAG